MPHGRKKKLFYGIIQGFSKLLHFFQRSSPTVQSTFFLLQRSFYATTLHNPQVSKATPTPALNDPETLNWSQVLCLLSGWGDHKSCFAFPQPALVFQHLTYRYACSWVGSKSTTPTCNTSQWTRDKGGQRAECNVVANKGLSSVNPCRICIDRRWGILKLLLFALDKNCAHCPFS